MKASYSPESLVQPSVARWNQGSSQTPSVPISVYRELAAELKATQARVDALSQQNQHLGQQNLFLRQELLKFAESAAQMRQAVEGHPAEGGEGFRPGIVPPPEKGRGLSLEGVSQFTSQMGQILSPRAKASNPAVRPPSSVTPPNRQPRVLYTEERLDPLRPSQGRTRTQDLSGVWLTATILLIVVSAFGAGFLIMKPLLNTSR